MDIILTPSLFCEYFEDYLKFPKTEYQIELAKLFLNPNNRFVISKDLITYLDRKYSKSPIGAYFQPFMADLFNYRSLTVGNVGNSSAKDEIHKSIENAYLALRKGKGNVDRIHFSLTNGEEVLSAHAIHLNKLSDKKRDWLHYKLCCQSPDPLVFTSSDFKSNDEIKELIADFFFWEGGEDFNILDRQANFDHELFDFFRKSHPVLYFTTANTYYQNEKGFREFFSSVRLFFGHRKDIHERKVHRNNFILHTDNDFWSLNLNDTTWTLLLSYNPNAAKLIKDKTFKKFNKKK